MQGCKTILLKLKVAEKKKKISLTILTTKAGFCLLNLLWQEGFIYGYKRYGLKVVVFLKSFFTCLGFFSKVVFYEKTMS